MASKNSKAEDAPLLGICDWGKHFETSRTRRVETLVWIRLTVKADSDGYLRFIDVPDGEKRLALFGAWTALIKVAARCNPRGVLVRDGTVPLTPEDIARRSMMGSDAVPVIAEAIERARSVGWLTPLTSAQVAAMRERESAGRVADETPGEEDAGGSSPGHPPVAARSTDGQGVVTPRSLDGQSVVTPRSLDGHSLVTSAGKNGALTREQFDEIWALFPKSRRMDKEKCFSLLAAHVKAGRKVEVLREATGRYAQAVKDAATPAKYILLAKTFFGPQGRVFDAMEADFVERYVASTNDSDEKPKPKAEWKPGTQWGVVFGEACKISKHPHSARMEYYSHGDWHELPPDIEIHKV